VEVGEKSNARSGGTDIVKEDRGLVYISEVVRESDVIIFCEADDMHSLSILIES
jgi:hypothetical protein